jgi:7,8-dihydropterin-6-yl-methyl-4-(beta-D-ribofuranosyl)aminobenzene 5'-phosphate synthase
MTAKLTILVDNQAGDGLSAEHGLSLWIEVAGRRILFDTGQGSALPGNAAKIGIDLDSTEIVIVSHGHYDHTGGLATVVQRAPAIHLYGHPSVLLARYSIRDGVVRDIAMPGSARMALECLPSARVHFTTGPTAIVPGVGITGSIPRLNDYENTGGPFFLDREAQQPDPIDDDMALWMSTPRGLVVVLGCGHSGVVNTLEWVSGLAGTSKIHAVLGGFHLREASDARLDRTLAALAQIAPDMVIPCHCTGEKAVDRLKQALGQRVKPGHAGMTLEFGSRNNRC